MHTIILRVKTEKALRAILASLPTDPSIGMSGYEVRFDDEYKAPSQSVGDGSLRDKILSRFGGQRNVRAKEIREWLSSNGYSENNISNTLSRLRKSGVVHHAAKNSWNFIGGGNGSEAQAH